MTFWCRDSLPLPRSEQCKWSEVRRTWVFVGCLKGEVPTKMRWRKGDDLKIWRYIWDILGIKMSYLTTMYCSIYETFDSGLFLPKIHVKRFASIHPKVPFQCTVYQSHDWLVASPHLKNISQNGNLPQIGVNIKNIWNHHLDDSHAPRFVFLNYQNRRKNSSKQNQRLEAQSSSEFLAPSLFLMDAFLLVVIFF